MGNTDMLYQIYENECLLHVSEREKLKGTIFFTKHMSCAHLQLCHHIAMCHLLPPPGRSAVGGFQTIILVSQ
jgi:hypothetical protein